MKDIAVFGAGGLGREIPCLLDKINVIDHQWNFIGFFDDGIEKGNLVDGHIVLGGIRELNEWGKDLSIAIGIGNPQVVEKIVNTINNSHIDFPNIIAPDVYFYDPSLVKIGRGNVLNHNMMVSIDVEIGDFNTFGANTVLGHDSKVGDFNTMMMASQICGHTVLNTHNFLGISSIVLQGLIVNSNVTLSAGSILMKNAVDDMTYFGNPARPMMKKE